MRAPRGRGGFGRIAPSVVGAAVVSSSILVASVTGTLSSFTASIQNSTNSVTSGSVVMKETNESGSVACLSTDNNTSNSATCGTINKYGGATLMPGAATGATKVKISNVGSSAVSSFTLVPASCAATVANSSLAASSGNLCAKVKLVLTCAIGSGTSTTLINGVYLNALAASYDIKSLSSGGCVPVPGESNAATFSFTLTMDSDASANVQNQVATQALTWTFNG